MEVAVRLQLVMLHLEPHAIMKWDRGTAPPQMTMTLQITVGMTQQQTAERTGWLVPTPATIVALTLLNRGWTFPT